MNGDLQKIDWEKIDNGILWADDWWDGIVSGVAEVDGRRVYFNCIEEDDKGNRKFAVYDVPKEIWELINERHNDFKKYVGSHWDFESSDGKTKRMIGDIRPQSKHYKFYKKWQDKEIKMKEEWLIAYSVIEF
jgi:hypothetical protein